MVVGRFSETWDTLSAGRSLLHHLHAKLDKQNSRTARNCAWRAVQIMLPGNPDLMGRGAWTCLRLQAGKQSRQRELRNTSAWPDGDCRHSAGTSLTLPAGHHDAFTTLALFAARNPTLV